MMLRHLKVFLGHKAIVISIWIQMHKNNSVSPRLNKNSNHIKCKKDFGTYNFVDDKNGDFFLSKNTLTHLLWYIEYLK